MTFTVIYEMTDKLGKMNNNLLFPSFFLSFFFSIVHQSINAAEVCIEYLTASAAKMIWPISFWQNCFSNLQHLMNSLLVKCLYKSFSYTLSNQHSFILTDPIWVTDRWSMKQVFSAKKKVHFPRQADITLACCPLKWHTLSLLMSRRLTLACCPSGWHNISLLSPKVTYLKPANVPQVDFSLLSLRLTKLQPAVPQTDITFTCCPSGWDNFHQLSLGLTKL